MSCVVKQKEQGQRREMCKENMPGVTEGNNDMDTSIGGADVSDAEKAGRMPCITERSNDADTCTGGASMSYAEKAGSVQFIESRQCYETKEEKRKFIRESF